MYRELPTLAASTASPSSAQASLQTKLGATSGLKRLAAVGLLAASVLLVGAALPADAEAHAPGCPTGSSTYAPWHAKRVYAVPHGCAWLVAPTRTVSGVGPTIALRIHAKTRRFSLGDQPVGDAAGYCGVDGFLVSWPHFVVTSTRVWLGQAGGCLRLPKRGIASDALLWAGHFRLTRGLGWNPAVDFMSPPYRR